MARPVTYTGARIFDGRSWLSASSFTVADGRFTRIGAGPEAGDEVRDLGGRLVLPGLIDAHCHPVELAEAAEQIALTPPSVHSIADITDAVRDRARSQPAGSWIVGWGYDEGKLREGRAPHRRDLDAVSPDHPVMLVRACGHIAAVNSVVLETLQVHRDTPDPEGGVFDRFPDGTPTGVLREHAKDLVYNILPPRDPDQVGRLLGRLAPHLLAHGLTSVSELTATYSPDKPELDSAAIFHAARRHGFPHPVSLFYVWDQIKRTPGRPRPQGPFTDGIRFGGIKMFADGSVTGRTAWVSPAFEPFAGLSGDDGIPLLDPDEIREGARQAAEWGVQLAVHAIGNRAIQQVVETLAELDPWLSDRPSARVEHGGLPEPAVLETAARAGIAFVMQPIFLYAEIESYVRHLGERRAAIQYPVRSALEAGVPLCLSSDAPATAWHDPSNPWLGIYTAVTRRVHDGRLFGPEEAIDAATAIRLYSAEAARVAGIPGGVIEVGAPADFAVYDAGVMSEPDRLPDVQAQETVMAGQVVYRRG
ncbi:MAG: amidohydrolase [Clostridia bacterium]